MFRLLRYCLAATLPAIAAPHGHANEFANLETLSTDPTWIKLVHYEPSRSGPSGWLSAILSDEFFLSEHGRHDPLAELQATINALQTPITDDNPNQHARCRFPARQLWLEQHFDLGGSDATRSHCPDFADWTRNGSVRSVSVVYATGYLGNPASYYGHTLLKLNFKDEKKTALMDTSINYGAIMATNDDPVSYILKGIFGGYDGGFSHIHYYYHDHNYGENELRDLWEYELDLPAPAVDLIVAHSWEVLGKRYQYFFFRKNCAYRMAELIELVHDIQIIPRQRPWTIPQSLIQNLSETNVDGAPLIARVIYHPSRQSRFYQRYQNLDNNQQSLLRDLVLQREDLNGETFQTHTVTAQHAILDTLIDYYQYVREPESGKQEAMHTQYRGALLKRLQLPPGIVAVEPQTPPPPHQGRPPGWVQTGPIYNSSSQESALSLRIRPAYYDVLDSDAGHVRNAALSMGDITLHLHRDRLRLRRLDIIAIESVNPALTGLPGDNGSAWSLRAGAEQLRLDCGNCVVANVQGDMGYGRQWTPYIFSAAYLGGAIQEDRLGHGFAYARASLRIIAGSGPKWRMVLNHEQRSPVGGHRQHYAVSRLEARHAIRPDMDIRLHYERNKGQELGIGIGFYW